MLCDEYDCGTVCHNVSVKIPSFAHMLDCQDAVILITLSYHEAVILLLLCYQGISVTPISKYGFLFHSVFSFLMSSISYV